MEPKFLKQISEDNCHIFTLKKSLYKLEDNSEAERVTINSKDWVSAIVKLRDFAKEFVMVKQYRYGAAKELVEFPCGIVEEGENPLQAILRECEEEIGLKTEDIVSIKKLYEKSSNPAFMTNKMTCFFIEANRINIDNSHPDKDENLEIVYLDSDEVERTIETSSNANVMMSYGWELYKKEVSERR